MGTSHRMNLEPKRCEMWKKMETGARGRVEDRRKRKNDEQCRVEIWLYFYIYIYLKNCYLPDQGAGRQQYLVNQLIQTWKAGCQTQRAGNSKPWENMFEPHVVFGLFQKTFCFKTCNYIVNYIKTPSWLNIEPNSTKNCKEVWNPGMWTYILQIYLHMRNPKTWQLKTENCQWLVSQKKMLWPWAQSFLPLHWCMKYGCCKLR